MIVITEEAGGMCGAGAAETREMTGEEDEEDGTEMTTGGEAEDSGTLVAATWGWVEAAAEE